MDKYVLNAKEAAAFLSISVSTLYRLTGEKRLTKVVLSKKRVGWTTKELTRFADTCTNDLLA